MNRLCWAVFCVFRPSEFELLPVQVAAFEFSDGLNNLKFWVGGFSRRFQVSMGVCRLKVFGKGFKGVVSR